MALTDVAIRTARPKEKPYKVADAQGLYLLVNPRGGKLWRVKYRMNGVERKLALGAYPEITLAEARAARDAARRQLAHAVDPSVAETSPHRGQRSREQQLRNHRRGTDREEGPRRPHASHVGKAALASAAAG